MYESRPTVQMKSNLLSHGKPLKTDLPIVISVAIWVYN